MKQLITPHLVDIIMVMCGVVIRRGFPDDLENLPRTALT